MTNEQIVEKIRNGSSVTNNMQRLYENNLPLIKRIIKPYAAYENVEDLLQEAYLGLWEAVQRYETSENVLFMTYAGYWIKRSAQRYIEKCGSVIRIPAATRQKIISYNKTVQKLVQEKSRMPTNKEIANSMMIAVSEVEELGQYSQSVSSLDAPLNEDEDITLCDNVQSDFDLENETIDKIYAEHTKYELWGTVERFIAKRENDIIQEYFLHNKSMVQIAREQNLSVQRVREIKESGLCRLRSGKAKRTLMEEFEIAECGIYRNSLSKYREHNATSTVEYVALRKVEIQEEYDRRVRELLNCISQKKACL